MEGERMRALEELIRELVKFTTHDPACEEALKKELVNVAVGEVSISPPRCTCGIRRLYAKIDELVD